jgi:hypothetical protein
MLKAREIKDINDKIDRQISRERGIDREIER